MKEQQKISLDIKRTLQESVGDILTDDEIHERYRSLKKRYTSLRNSTAASPADSLAGLCYYHNIENFSIFTGIFSLLDGQITEISSFGAAGMDNRIITAMENHTASIREKQFITITPEDEPSLKNDLHLYAFERHGKTLCISAASSSSPFFKKKTLIYFGNFLETLFPSQRKKPFGTTDIFHSIELFIDHNARTFDLYAQLFYFPGLDRIF
ncbi:MAG: hypothetical protein ACRCUT_03740, partial [Spirochaetota bacterium]